MPSQRAVSPITPARAWTIAALLFTAGFINYLDRAIVSVALPVIAADLHLGPTAKGVLLSAFFWSYALMQMPMGWAVDRYNLRWLYSIAFALWSLACGFTGFVSTVGALMLMRAVLGIGESVYLPGGMKTINLLFGPKERGLASGLMDCGTRAGLALGAPAIAFLVHAIGWHQSFFVLGFGSLLWLIPWLAVFPSVVSEKSIAPHNSLSQIVNSFDRNLLGMCIGHFCYGYYWYLLVTWLPDYLVESRHMTLQRAGLYAMFPYLVFSLSLPMGGWIADRFVSLGYNERRSRKAVVTVSFLSSLMLLIGASMPGDTAAVAFITAASLVGLSTPNLYVLLAMSAPEGTVGTWMGVMNFAGNVPGVLAPIVTGILIARTGSYFPGFVVAVVILNLGLPAYWWIVGERKHVTTSETL